MNMATIISYEFPRTLHDRSNAQASRSVQSGDGQGTGLPSRLLAFDIP